MKRSSTCWHRKHYSPVWTISCFFRLARCVNCFGHSLHWKGFSSILQRGRSDLVIILWIVPVFYFYKCNLLVWMTLCFTRFAACEKHLLQMSQMCGFSPVCTNICCEMNRIESKFDIFGVHKIRFWLFLFLLLFSPYVDWPVAWTIFRTRSICKRVPLYDTFYVSTNCYACWMFSCIRCIRMLFPGHCHCRRRRRHRQRRYQLSPDSCYSFVHDVPFDEQLIALHY